MLLTLVLIYQIIVTFASPFNKCPFVYLLNVGDEELDKTNTEQIRVSLPGGSAALRYPAFGFGDNITNVRVTAIDYIKNMQAKMIDGGPGFNYVVLAFLGYSEVPYEVLVTIQTKPNVFDSDQAFENDVSKTSGDNSDPCGVEQDKNDSSEDTEEEPQNDNRRTKMNPELMQPSPNVQIYDLNNEPYSGKEKYGIVYDNQQDNSSEEDDSKDVENYVDEQNSEFENEVNKNTMNDTDDSDDTADDIAYAQDIHRPTPEQFSDTPNVGTETTSAATQSYSKYIDIVPVEEKYNDNNYDDDYKINNLFRRYEALKPHLNNKHAVEQKHNVDIDKDEKLGYKDGSVEIDEMFNDEEVHNDDKYSNHDKYSDKKNDNNFDTNDAYAVEY